MLLEIVPTLQMGGTISFFAHECCRYFAVTIVNPALFTLALCVVFYAKKCKNNGCRKYGTLLWSYKPLVMH